MAGIVFDTSKTRIKISGQLLNIISLYRRTSALYLAQIQTQHTRHIHWTRFLTPFFLIRISLDAGIRDSGKEIYSYTGNFERNARCWPFAAEPCPWNCVRPRGVGFLHGRLGGIWINTASAVGIVFTGVASRAERKKCLERTRRLRFVEGLCPRSRY